MSKLSKNLVFLNENVPKYRIIGLQGGTRSGKTYSAVQWAIRFCHKYSGVTISICRDTFNALKATTMRDFFDLLNEAGVYNQKNYNATDHIYFLNGNYIEFFGLDSPGKVQGRKRDILIVDEALSTGDAKFKEKSLNRIKELRSDDRALILVSHAMATLRDVCNDVAWLHKGTLVQRGAPDATIDAYQEFLQVGKSAAIDEDV